jgi:glycosyltransferase involved in cell wall biosynthesis
MKVVLIGPYPPPHGGVQTHLVALQQFLTRQGADVSVINVARHTGKASPPGVFFPSSSLGVLQLLFRLRPDVIHYHAGGTLPARVLGLALATTLVPRAATVFTFHSGGFPTSPEGRSVGPASVTGFILRRIDRLIAVNPELAAWYAQAGVSPSHVEQISPFGGLADDGTAELPAALENFLRSHSPVIATVGLLEPEYDLELQIAALGQLRRHFPKAGLVMVGSGSLANSLRARVESDSNRDHLLLSGDLPHQIALQIIRRSDVLARTTWYDGDALSVREALALGTPVIASDTGMRPAGVVTIPPRDRDALVTAITAIARRPAPRSVTPDRSEPDGRALSAVFRVYQSLALGNGRAVDGALAGSAQKNAPIP